MQHYALFRLHEGRPSGCYPVTRRGAAIVNLFIYLRHKNSRLVWATSYALVNFERCKDKENV